MPDSGQVVAFPGVIEDAPLVGIDAPITCLHRQVEYSVRDRTVRCRQCNELVDPFDALVAAAEREAFRLRMQADERERKRRAAEARGNRRRAKAAAVQLAAPPVLPVQEALQRLAAMRDRLSR